MKDPFLLKESKNQVSYCALFILERLLMLLTNPKEKLPLLLVLDKKHDDVRADLDYPVLNQPLGHLWIIFSKCFSVLLYFYSNYTGCWCFFSVSEQ